MLDDKSIMDLRAMFAGYALSGYVREGVSYASRKDECKEVAEACFDLADACLTELLIRTEKRSSSTKDK